jgi:hypothetical protein
MQINPFNVFQLYLSCDNNHLEVWDYKDGVLLKEYDFKTCIKSFQVDPRKQSSIFISFGNLYHVDLCDIDNKRILLSENCDLFSLSNTGDYLAFINNLSNELSLLKISESINN